MLVLLPGSWSPESNLNLSAIDIDVVPQVGVVVDDLDVSPRLMDDRLRREFTPFLRDHVRVRVLATVAKPISSRRAGERSGHRNGASKQSVALP